MTPALSCVTWNIHRGRGNDGRYDPDRTLDTLYREVWQPTADVLILQEADADPPPHKGVLDPNQVETLTGLRHLHSDPATRSTHESHGFLGVIVYLAPQIEVEALRLVDLPGHCARGAVVVDMQKAGIKLRLIATHLPLAQVLRVAQMRTLAQHMDRFDDRQTILCGDLNEWRPWGGLALGQRVMGRTFRGPARATFPVQFPLLPLDRILTTGPGRVEDARVLDGPGIRATSDHRPLTARVTLCGATSAKTPRPA